MDKLKIGDGRMEGLRIFYKRSVIMGILGLFVIQILFFLYLQSNYKNDETEAYHAQEKEYIEGYHNSIGEIIASADQMNLVSIFSQNDSFSQKNGEKTKKDFEKILEVEPVYFKNAYLFRFFQYAYLEIFTLLCGFLIALCLADRGKGNIKNVIYSTVNGRGRIVWDKILSLFLWDAAVLFLFYWGTVGASCVFYGRNIFPVLHYPIQSLSLFADFTWNVTIGQFLCLFYVYKLIVLFLNTLFIWVLLFFADNILFAGGALAGAVMLEFFLYRFIGNSHPLNVLHYCNVWYYTLGIAFFAEYKNMNLFSGAMDKNAVIFAVVVSGIVILSIVAVIIPCKKYPGASLMAKGKGRWKGIRIKRREMGALSWKLAEFRKILISQKAAVLIAAYVLFLLAGTDVTNIQLSESQQLYYGFIDRHKGVPDRESEAEIDELRQTLQDVDEIYEQRYKEYESGEMSASDWISVCIWYDTFQEQRLFLRQIEEQTDYLSQMKQEGMEAWYVNVYGYNHWFSQNETIQMVVLIVFLVLISNAIFRYEKKSGMLHLLKCCPDGRGKLFRQKTGTSWFCSFFLYFMMVIREMIQLKIVYGTDGWEAPVQSLPQLHFVEWHCNIITFYIFVCLVKGVVLLGVADITLFLSVYGGKRIVGVLLLAVCIPIVLDFIGKKQVGQLSIANIALVTPVLMESGSMWAGVVILVVFAAGNLFFMRRLYRQWCIT